MSDNSEKIVYVTNFGKKYHFKTQCQYIKGKEYFSISLKEAKQMYEGACSKCRTYNNAFNNNPSINKFNKYNNNNFKLNIFQKNKNNNYFYYNNNLYDRPYSVYKTNDNINQVNNINLNHNVIEEKEEKKLEDSKNPKNFSDFLSSSSSFTKIINNQFLSSEKNSDIDFNNINKFKNNNEVEISSFLNNNNLLKNINFFEQSKQIEKNSLINEHNNNELIEEEKQEEYSINNHNMSNDNEIINLISKYENKSLLFNSKSIISNNIEINKQKNLNKNYISDKKKNNINILICLLKNKKIILFLFKIIVIIFQIIKI